MAVTFAVSLQKSNRDKERNILIKAGLLTEHLSNAWIHLTIFSDSYDNTMRLTLQDSYKVSTPNHPFLIITAKQLIDIYAVQKLLPKSNLGLAVGMTKLNYRNTQTLMFSKYKDLLKTEETSND